jgi:acyl-coenzyme A synthetase/AMP-(fatty) acid ligase
MIPRGAPMAELDRAGTVYPVLRHAGDEDIVAVRGGVFIRRGQFLGDVAALASRLPAHRYVMNLCADRYRFMVGFAAALCRGQESLLPPSAAPGVLEAVAEDYPDLYALTDEAALPFASFPFPDHLETSGAAGGVPEVAGAQQALILFTSGSTGRPAPVPKSWGVLVRSALSAGARLGVAEMGGATVIGTVPHQHSYGLESTVMLGLQHGLIVDAGGLFFPADIRAALAAADQKGILVTTPVHLRALAADSGGMPAAGLILSATAPLPLSLAAEAEACFRAPLIEIYGCTEAGQVATRQTVRDAAWQCLDGVTLVARDGGIWASGDAVEGAALLHDEIEQTGPDIFMLGGRSADLVDVAGKRMSLEYLNHHLLAIEGVSDGVFLKPDTCGDDVARLAALVVAPGLRAEALLGALRARIDAAFLPRPLVFVDALPRNALGKLPRQALLDLLRGEGSDAVG